MKLNDHKEWKIQSQFRSLQLTPEPLLRYQ